MKLKKCFVVCWYGQWPIYFQLYLNSCKNNLEWNWVIFTDTSIENYDIPHNISIVYMPFDKLKKRLEKKLLIKVDRLTPYKLCDFKPTYGFIFEEYLKDYDYWGYCDIDLIWGNLSSFFPDNEIGQYDKFGVKGHMTLFKNSNENKYLFREKITKFVDYHTILNSKYNWGFDEIGRYSIDKIIRKKDDYTCYRNSENIADILPYDKLSTGEAINGILQKKYIQFVFINGENIYVKYENNEFLIEKAYVHLQKRKILHYDVEEGKSFYIFDNEIVSEIEKCKNIVFIDDVIPSKLNLRINQLMRLVEVIRYHVRSKTMKKKGKHRS